MTGLSAARAGMIRTAGLKRKLGGFHLAPAPPTSGRQHEAFPVMEQQPLTTALLGCFATWLTR